MATATYELPYEGAKEMLLVEDVDSKEYLAGLLMQCMTNCRFINQIIKIIENKNLAWKCVVTGLIITGLMLFLLMPLFVK